MSNEGPFLPKHERDALVLSHMKGARNFARVMAGKRAAAERVEDLECEAIAGLVDAAERFDPSRGAPFKSVAFLWMRMRCRTYLDRYRGPVKITTGSQRKGIIYKLSKAEKDLERELGRKPHRAETAERLGCTEEEILQAKSRIQNIGQHIAHTDCNVVDHRDSRGLVLADDGATSSEDMLGDMERDRNMKLAVGSAMSVLTAREREVIRRRFLDEREGLAEIGADLGVCRERVRQIEAKALKKIRAALKEREVLEALG